MALKTERAEASIPPNTTVLELALYRKYTWQNSTYEQGKPYRFRNADAMLLLAEQDTGRPVWRLWREQRPKPAPKTEVTDATSIQAHELTEDERLMGPVTTKQPAKRIDIGDDSEIADILAPPSNEGDVTV